MAQDPTAMQAARIVGRKTIVSRSRAWTRYQRRRAIGRKAGILRRNYGRDEVKYWTKGEPGRLSKGKIHCSCWMCRRKSYDEPSMADRRKTVCALMEMKEELK